MGEESPRVEEHVGRNTLSFEPPALLHFTLCGTLSPEDVRAMGLFVRRRVEEGRRALILMLGCAELTGLSAAGRKVAVQESGDFPYVGIVFYGASFQAKIVMKLTLGAMSLLPWFWQAKSCFCDTEVEARSWAERRFAEVALEMRGQRA
jgi:hypothetical protein